ncbi:MAG: hypothetical protein JO311_07780, partial [Candidatus Eremiobacteraeota bacterium]|nr:hypothetical protein [Candidatus Eremiobacteraeota bacterium]
MMMLRLAFALAGTVALAIPSLAPAAPARPAAPAKPAPKGIAAKPAPPRAAAAASSSGSQTSFNLGVWTVHASSIDANFKSGDFSTPSKLVMTRVGGDVSADRANGNYKRQV